MDGQDERDERDRPSCPARLRFRQGFMRPSQPARPACPRFRPIYYKKDLKTTPMVLIIKDVCLVLEIRVDVPNKNQKEYIQRRGGNGPKKKKVDDDNSNSTTHKKVVDVNMVDDAAEKNKVGGYRLLDMGIFAELVKDLLCPVCCDSRLCQY